MKRILYYIGTLLTAAGSLVEAQNIQGKVTDTDNHPVDGVAVVLQTLDSVYLDAIVTDSLGRFLFHHPADQRYRLLFQHLLYESVQKEIAEEDAGIIRLKSKQYELDGVVVKAQRPQVKVEGGALKYDVPQLMKDKAVSNAFEIVKQIPGVIGTDDAVSLIGAGSSGIVINGQLTTMTMEQLVNLLRTIPASRVRSVEVMYKAPARYQIKGALINVVLDNGTGEAPALQGEVGIDYLQQHYAGGKAHANLLYSTPRLSVDFLADGYKGRVYMGEEILARHTLQDKVTEIKQSGRGSSSPLTGTMRLGLDYTFNNEDKLSASYYLNPKRSASYRASTTRFQELKPTVSAFDERVSRTDVADKSTLHNIRLEYNSHSLLMAGGDFTRYHTPAFQTFLEKNETGILTDMQNNSKQDISQGALFINHTNTFGTEWTLNYGVHAGFTSSKTYIAYSYNTGNGYEADPASLENNRQKEYNGTVFAELSKRFNERFSATVSLKAEYFKSDYTSNGVRSTLWNDWAFFPNASLSYVFSPSQVLQLNVNSDKSYPAYWYLTPQQTPLNAYSVVVGNPALKPYRSYNAQLLYILKQKYTCIAFTQYVPDHFAQMPYQSTTELKNIFRYENMDFQLQSGIGVVVPFRVGEFWSSQVTLTGIRMQDKSTHFHDLSFDNIKYLAQASMHTTFTLSKSRPNLKLDLNGMYLSGAVQGVYDAGSLYDVSAALKWQFADDKATLMMKCNNIFRSGSPDTKIDQSGQYSTVKQLDDTRCFTVSFVWKFGGFKQKEHEQVDISRFGK